MTVEYFLTLFTDLACVIVRIFDLTTEKEVCVSLPADRWDPLPDLDEYLDYGVESADLYKANNDGYITLEINIETDEEDDE